MEMEKHLVLVGGGHAHMTTMLNLRDYIDRGHRVTLVSPSPYQYYSGMGPGLLGGTYRPEQVRFHIRKMVEKRGGKFVEDRVVRIEASPRRLVLASGNSLDYDIASFNTGSSVPMEKAGAAGDDVIAVKPIQNLLGARRWILEQVRNSTVDLLVVGGGPAGLELAGNLWRLVNEAGGKAHISLVAGGRLMGGFPEKVRQFALESLGQRGIRMIEGAKTTHVADGRAVLTDGSTLGYDMAFIAAGITPSTLFRESGLPVGEDGGLLVNNSLQSVASPELFGGGDCISLQGQPLDKVGVYAVRENPILHHNLLAALEGSELETFEPQKDYMLIFNLGNHRGIFVKNGWVWHGRPAFYLKDWIDRKFMKKYQVSGELTESDRAESSK